MWLGLGVTSKGTVRVRVRVRVRCATMHTAQNRFAFLIAPTSGLKNRQDITRSVQSVKV